VGKFPFEVLSVEVGCPILFRISSSFQKSETLQMIVIESQENLIFYWMSAGAIQHFENCPLLNLAIKMDYCFIDSEELKR
jgi:hypothetical protein